MPLLDKVTFALLNFINKIYFCSYKGLPKLINDNFDSPIHIIYRISDAGYNKIKLSNVSNENCLKNAVSVFPLDKVKWTIICDNCSPKTMKMIRSYLPEESIVQVSVGHGAGTFNLALDMALSFSDDSVVYFLENDYLHVKKSLDILKDGFALGADILTLYDHPDKYQNTHPLFYYMSKNTHIYLGRLCHWRSEFSTTMTFAAKVSFLKKYQKVFRKYTSGRHPYDFNIFRELCTKGVELICPIPGASTHGETAFLGPFVNWNKV